MIEQAKVPRKKRAEADTHLRSAVKKILSHLKNGGGLDVFLPTEYDSASEPEPAAKQSEIERAGKLFEDFRSILLKTGDDLPKLLEDFNFDDEH